MSRAADALARVWFRPPVIIPGQVIRTGMGVTVGPSEEELASVSATSRTVTAPNGEEVTVGATVHWRVDGPLPKPGALITLPPQFGLSEKREVVTARRVDSGNSLTPGHVEVTLR